MLPAEEKRIIDPSMGLKGSLNPVSRDKFIILGIILADMS